MHYNCIGVWALRFCVCDFVILFVSLFASVSEYISHYFIFTSKSQSKFDLIKFVITIILILLLWNFKNQLLLQPPCPLMIKVIMDNFIWSFNGFIFSAKLCMNESFLSKVSIKSNGNVTCGVEMLILSLILNKLLKTNKFNSIVISVLIIFFVVSTRQASSHVRKNTIICLFGV